LAHLDILAREDLAARAEVIGQRLGEGLQTLVNGNTIIGTRGTMGIWALALGDGIDATAVRDALMARGVIARPLGTSTLAFCPPLVISDEQMDLCVEATAAAVAEVARNKSRPFP
jgi:putrescine---pyruvate transaminase